MHRQASWTIAADGCRKIRQAPSAKPQPRQRDQLENLQLLLQLPRQLPRPRALPKLRPDPQQRLPNPQARLPHPKARLGLRMWMQRRRPSGNARPWTLTARMSFQVRTRARSSASIFHASKPFRVLQRNTSIWLQLHVEMKPWQSLTYCRVKGRQHGWGTLLLRSDSTIHLRVNKTSGFN